MQPLIWVPALVASGVIAFAGLVGFLARHWLAAKITHGFNQKLEDVRADLRSKEAEISALRDGVLSGRTNRQALLDKRRLEAVERIWAAMLELAPLIYVSNVLSVLKVDELAKVAHKDPIVKQIFEMVIQPVGKVSLTNSASKERPFVSPISWALFSAYQSILVGAYSQAKFLELGIEDSQKYINIKGVAEVLKAALPDYVQYIDNVGSAGYHYLLDIIQEKLLVSLKETLKGADLDEEGVVQATNILKAVQAAVEQNKSPLAKAGN